MGDKMKKPSIKEIPLEMRDYLIMDMEDVVNRAAKIESFFRNSVEYKNYLSYMKQTIGIHNCPHFGDDIDFVEEKMRIECHHIITLYDLVLMVGAKLLLETEDEYITVFEVLTELVLLHLRDMVPICMLSLTIHEMHHNGLYEIPKDAKSLHLGKYNEFYNEYKDFFSDKYFEKYEYFGVNLRENVS